MGRRIGLTTFAALALSIAFATLAQAQPGTPARPSGITSRVLVKTTTTSTGQPLEFPSSAAQVTAVFLELDQGGQTGRVTFLVPIVLYIVEGAVELEIQGQAPRALTAGQVLAAPVNTPIAAVNRTTAPAKILEVFYGDARKPNQSPSQSSNAVGLRSTPVLQTMKTWTGEEIVFPPRANQFLALVVDFAPGAVNPRHVHPHVQFAYGLEGDTTVEPDGLPAQTFRPGQAFVETIKPHVGANRGASKGSIFTIFVGRSGHTANEGPAPTLSCLLHGDPQSVTRTPAKGA